MINTEFFKAVKEMRQAQKDYFRMRVSDNLNAAKQKEREVDNLIRDIEKVKLPEQKEIF